MNRFDEGRVMDDAVEELWILFAVGLLVEQEVVLADGRRREGVSFDEVGAAGEVAGVDFSNHLGPCEEKDFVVSLEIFS